MDLQQELLEKRKKLSDLKGNLSKANCAHKNSSDTYRQMELEINYLKDDIDELEAKISNL